MIGASLVDRVAKVLRLTNDLAASIESPVLLLRNGAARSSTIGNQFWCVVGVRESHARAITESSWKGFACSLTKQDLLEIDSVRSALEASGERTLATITQSKPNTWNDVQIKYILDLLEHEAQHHGQLIRYFYANNIAFPKAFAENYALK